MKFSVGDYVSYKEHKRHGDLVTEFVDRWGYGPFEIIRIDDNNSIYFATPGGESVVQAPCGKPWKHNEGSLQLDQFLTAARRAIADETQV